MASDPSDYRSTLIALGGALLVGLVIPLFFISDPAPTDDVTRLDAPPRALRPPVIVGNAPRIPRDDGELLPDSERYREAPKEEKALLPDELPVAKVEEPTPAVRRKTKDDYDPLLVDKASRFLRARGNTAEASEELLRRGAQHLGRELLPAEREEALDLIQQLRP